MTIARLSSRASAAALPLRCENRNMNTVTVTLGEKLFEFSSKLDWINKGPRIWRTHQATEGRAISIDAKGRICQCGAEFMRAEKDNAYPVSVYRVQPDSPLNGSDLDLSAKALYGEHGMDTDFY